MTCTAKMGVEEIRKHFFDSYWTKWTEVDSQSVTFWPYAIKILISSLIPMQVSIDQITSAKQILDH